MRVGWGRGQMRVGEGGADASGVGGGGDLEGALAAVERRGALVRVAHRVLRDAQVHPCQRDSDHAQGAGSSWEPWPFPRVAHRDLRDAQVHPLGGGARAFQKRVPGKCTASLLGQSFSASLAESPEGPAAVAWLPLVTPDRPKTGNGNRTSPSYRKTPTLAAQGGGQGTTQISLKNFVLKTAPVKARIWP